MPNKSPACFLVDFAVLSVCEVSCNLLTVSVFFEMSFCQVETAICGVAEKLLMEGQPENATRLLLLSSNLSGKV